MSLTVAAQNACQCDRFGPWRLLREGVSEQKFGARRTSQRRCRFVSSLAPRLLDHVAGRAQALATKCAGVRKKAEADIEEAHRSQESVRE